MLGDDAKARKMPQSTPALQKDVTEGYGLHLRTCFPKRIQYVREKDSPLSSVFSFQIYHLSQHLFEIIPMLE